MKKLMSLWTVLLYMITTSLTFLVSASHSPLHEDMSGPSDEICAAALDDTQEHYTYQNDCFRICFGNGFSGVAPALLTPKTQLQETSEEDHENNNNECHQYFHAQEGAATFKNSYNKHNQSNPGPYVGYIGKITVLLI